MSIDRKNADVNRQGRLVKKGSKTTLLLFMNLTGKEEAKRKINR